MIVTATDGVPLAVQESGDPAGPTVVAVHGYPDNAAVWDAVVQRLPGHYRVLRWDVRGAGGSGRPKARSGYRLEQLRADFSSVLDACQVTEPVHLLAHDWGSIQAWDWATDPVSRPRIASLSSISGPHLGQASAWFASLLRPSRASLTTLARQLGHSYYLLLFQLPWLPELAWRSGLVDRLLGAAVPAVGGYARTLADRLNGLGLYRANLLSRQTSRHLRTTVPVQVLAPSGDPFVGVPLQTEAPRPFVADLTVRVVHGGHWIQLADPQLVADWLSAFVDGPPARK